MLLKPQDILVLLKLVALEKTEWSYNRLAVALFMSPAEVHAAAKRALSAQLAAMGDQTAIVPNVRNLEEFLVHGVKYVFVPELGAMTRGIPTGHAAPPLMEHFIPSTEPPPVWPDPDGDVRGQAFAPLYRSVPSAAREDHALYELLVLVDAIRGGRSRERAIAIRELQERLARYETGSQSKY